MTAALQAVKIDGKSLRQAAKQYDVPVTTLKRRVDGEVAVDARPGPATVLTKEEEKLCRYCFDV
jgi:transposase